MPLGWEGPENPTGGVSQLKVGAMLSYASVVLGGIIAIAYTPIMLRLLGQSEYGLYSLVSSVVSYLGLLSFGFGGAYLRFYARYRVVDDRPNVAKLNGMFLIVFLAIGGFALAAGAGLTVNSDRILGNKLTADELATAKILLAIMVVNIALSFPASIFDSYVAANERFIFQKALQVLRTIVSPFVVLPILLLGYGSIGMVAATTAITILVETYTVLFCLKTLKMKFQFGNLDLSLMREVTVFSLYIFSNIVVDQINWNADKYLIGRFKGTVPVAVYGIAALLNVYYISLSVTVSSVFVPRVNRLVAIATDDWELTKLFTRVGRVQFILLGSVCAGLVVFGRPFITVWAGRDYRDAYPIALLLMIPVTIPLIQNLGIEIQKAKNLHRFRSWTYLAVAAMNVSISVPLIQLYGGIGAAIGTAVALLVGNGLLMNWYYHKRVGLNIRYFWMEILRLAPALVPTLLVGGGLMLLVDLYEPVALLVWATVFAVVYCASMWWLGMNRYEKDLVGVPLKRALQRIRSR